MLYSSIDVPMECVYRGCTNRYFQYLSLIHCSDASMLSYDRRRMKRKLQNYLDSICYDDGQVWFNKYCPIQVCNYEANLCFEEEFKNRGANQKIHMTLFTDLQSINLWCYGETIKLANSKSSGCLCLKQLVMSIGSFTARHEAHHRVRIRESHQHQRPGYNIENIYLKW